MVSSDYEQTESLNIEQEALYTIDLKRQYSLSNTKALPKEATTYELESFDKNALVIFNQKEINGHETRLGTEKDVDALTRTFKTFGFEVTPHNNLTKNALFEELKTFSDRDFTDYGCVAVAILTHGSNDGRLCAKDQLYKESEVVDLFKVYSSSKTNPNFTLVTKPKIFIIQACRGSKTCSGVQVHQSGNICKDSIKKSDSHYVLPLESDLLIFHSSYPGYVSHRDPLRGSWFIQTLCKKINTLYSDLDLESIITEVKRDVAIGMEYKEVNEMNFNKQMPVVTSTLIRKLNLKKSGGFPRLFALEKPNVNKSGRRSESRHEVLDAVNSSPMTPQLILEFTHMRNCLRYFVAENPNDETAQGILDVANTYEDSEELNKSKYKMCKVISKYLMDKAEEDSHFYKYLHFVPLERKATKPKNAQNELSMSLKSSFSFLDICLTGIFVANFVLVLRNMKSN